MKTRKAFLAIFLILSLFLVGNLSSAEENIQPENSTVLEETLGPSEEVEQDEDVDPSALDTEDPLLLPDHPLYFFKGWARNIRSFFAFSATSKSKLESQFANEKLIEIKKMVAANKNPEAIQKALSNYEKSIEKIKLFADKIKDKGDKNVNIFLDKYTQHQALHQRILEKLEGQVPPEVFEKIKQVRELHLERFGDVLLKLEDKDQIPERLENNLNKIKGSKFRDFKNLELFEALKDKLPEDTQDEMEAKKEELLERLRERLENLSPEEQEKLKNYIDKVGGDKLEHLYILNSLEGTELSDNLRKLMENVKERKVEQIENKYALVKGNKEMAEDKINEAERLLSEAEGLVVKNDINKEEMPAVFRLLEEAAEKLQAAKDHYENEDWGRAFGQATASASLSENVIRIIKIRLGYPDLEATACRNIDYPVCGDDGNSYRNICEAKRAGVKIVYRGRCRTELDCAGENERVNRNPLLGATNRVCCEGLEEIRTNRTYSICNKPGLSYECQEDKDCPLPRCPGFLSKCVDNKCLIPRCKSPVNCIQVITPAKNPNTGACKDFPTPCDVPEGWIKVNACPGSLPIRIPIKQPSVTDIEISSGPKSIQ